MAAADREAVSTGGAEDSWGWEPVPEIADGSEAAGSLPENHVQGNSLAHNGFYGGKKRHSYQKFAGQGGEFTTGMTSSPSFQELEQAIGESLAMNLSPANSSGDLSASRYSPGSGMRRSGSKGKFGNSPRNQYRNHFVVQQAPGMLPKGVPGSTHGNMGVYSMPPMPGSMGATPGRGGGGGSPPALEVEMLQANTMDTRTELAPHIIEMKSRALILFHSPLMSPTAVRNACQKFGVLYYIRPEFHTKGFTLLSYFDLNIAEAAQANLPTELGDDLASAHFSVMLHAMSTNTEESQLVLSNLPRKASSEGGDEEGSEVSEEGFANIKSVCARYGPIRRIERVPGGASIDEVIVRESSASDDTSVVVEYINIQDARLATSELSANSSQLFGIGATVEVAPLAKHKQASCRQLLASLSRWRAELAASQMRQQMQQMQQQQQQQQHSMMQAASIAQAGMASNSLPMNLMNPVMYQQQGQGMQFAAAMGMYPQNVQELMQTSQVAGNAPYMNYKAKGGSVVPKDSLYYQSEHAMYSTSGSSKEGVSGGGGMREATSSESRGMKESHQMGLHSAQQQMGQQKSQSLLQQQPQQHQPPGMSTHTHNQKPLHHYPNYVHRKSTKEHQDDTEYVLDTNKISAHKDLRTTVMVRNIPNKYTQQMLLDEVNVNHERTYDFFYLPIDFKNRCNVGYAFINFVNPEHIVKFSDEFQGHRWKNFNSGKVCDITYARIQGQAAMVTRFQNSSLLEKDDAYKPLLFRGGMRVPFPEAKKGGGGNGGGNGGGYALTRRDSTEGGSRETKDRGGSSSESKGGNGSGNGLRSDKTP